MKNCKFSYDQEVKVCKGFYRGQKGVVKEFIDKDDGYYYKVQIGKKLQEFSELELKSNNFFSL